MYNNNMQCQRIKKDGEQCKNSALVGREYCKFHWGAVPSGRDNYRFKTGRWSKDLPVRLAATYLEMLHDEEWLDLKDDNALMMVRVEDLLGKIDFGESIKLWEKLGNHYKKAVDYSHRGDVDKARIELDKLGALINRGLSESYTWREVMSILEQRRRLVETQRRLDQDKGRNISVDRAMIWVGAIMDSITRALTDELPPDKARKILRVVGNDMNRLLYMDPSPSENMEGVHKGIVDGRGFPAGDS